MGTGFTQEAPEPARPDSALAPAPAEPVVAAGMGVESTVMLARAVGNRAFAGAVAAAGAPPPPSPLSGRVSGRVISRDWWDDIGQASGLWGEPARRAEAGGGNSPAAVAEAARKAAEEIRRKEEANLLARLRTQLSTQVVAIIPTIKSKITAGGEAPDLSSIMGRINAVQSAVHSIESGLPDRLKAIAGEINQRLTSGNQTLFLYEGKLDSAKGTASAQLASAKGNLGHAMASGTAASPTPAPSAGGGAPAPAPAPAPGGGPAPATLTPDETAAIGACAGLFESAIEEVDGIKDKKEIDGVVEFVRTLGPAAGGLKQQVQNADVLHFISAAERQVDLAIQALETAKHSKRENLKAATESIDSAHALADAFVGRLTGEEEKLRAGKDPSAPDGGGGRPGGLHDPLGP